MKTMKSWTFFGLAMISIMAMLVLLAAAMHQPGIFAVMLVVFSLLWSGRRGFSRLTNCYGAVSSGGDAMHRLYTIKLTHTSAVACGDIVVIGGRVVEACDDYLANAEGVYICRGKRIWPKETSLAVSAFAQVYWDAGNNVVTTTAAGNTPIGMCVEAALSADTTITFLLLPVANGAITPSALKTRTVVALTDAAATPTATQLIDSSIFTMTPSAGRNFTPPTAAQLVAACKGAQVGTCFDFTIISLAAFAVTVQTASGVTLVGSMAANNAAATFRARFDNVTSAAEAVTIYRI